VDAATEERLVRQIVTLNGEIETYQRSMAEVAKLRERKVRALREHGWSIGKIATRTGLSRARVAQILS
jgi:AraC-like DNA-binding protein